MSEPFGDVTVDALRVALGRTARRAAVIAANLANLETPGFRAREVRFDGPLAAPGRLETLRSHPAHLAPGADERIRGRIEPAPVTRVRNDGNTVDLDREMTLLAMVQGRYQAATEMVRKRFALLVYAATDGRGGR